VSPLSAEGLRKLSALRQKDPQAWREICDLVFEVERREQKASYERSFISFIKAAFSQVDPAPLRLAWFQECIAEHLEAVCNGKLRYLVINAPPRCMKSLLVSVLYPAWVWCRGDIGPQSGPQVSFFACSYSAILAEELAVKMRRLVFGAWYQSMWPRVRPVLDQASRANFANTAGGARISSSVESGLLGRGGDIQLLDDLMTLKQAESELETRAVLAAFHEGLPTRVTNPNTASRVLVGERVSENDVTNAALETWGSECVHLMFPARYEVLRNCPQDKRTYEGELLWPEVWSEPEIRKLELGLSGLEKGQSALSSFAVSAQLQQAPIPRGGQTIPSDSTSTAGRPWWSRLTPPTRMTKARR
jgi:hypothetical protein